MARSGENLTSLIVGLGNPGSRYEETRHNLGFRVVETVSARLEIKVGKLECNSLVGATDDLILARPQTYMNRSGFAVRCLAERYGLETDRILVVYDEVVLPLGRLRFRSRGGPAGHRGMESVIGNLRTEEVPRLRLGVGPSADEGAPADLVDFVLGDFTNEERENVDELIDRAAAACECWLSEGAEATMRRFNG